MKKYNCEIAIIGSGPAGEKAAIEASRHTDKIIVIEKGLRPGGAGEISGTIPSKSIRETVQFVNMVCKNEASGINIDLIKTLTIKELMQRKNRVIASRVRDILDKYNKAGIQYISGKAGFISDHELKVECPNPDDNSIIYAEKILIAAGTRPYNPDDVHFDHKFIFDSDSVLGLTNIPEEIAIYGGGVIGCEYASIFSKLGAKVYLIDPRGKLLSFIDSELSSALSRLMINSGVELLLGESYKEIKAVNDKVRIVLNSGSVIESPHLLFANGREGLSGSLNLSACGLKVNGRNQLDVNENFQTEKSHIYAAGDIIGFPSLVSVSNEEGRRVIKHALKGEKVSRVTSGIPWAIYTIPEISMIGKSEDELIQEKIPFKKGVCNYGELARGQILGETEGMVKVLFHRESHKILGIHILGSMAAELIHIGQAVMELGGTIEYFIENVINFPTLSSGYKVAAMNGLSG